MARTGDLPTALADVHPRHRVPQRAVLVVAAAVCALVLTLDLRGAIGFSSFGVLLYYLVANLAARTQDAAHRRFPRALQVLGAAGCVTLVATLPWRSVVGGLVVCGLGLLHRLLRQAARAR
jgi:APA family basic amino acid/polyamine antiporter